MRAKSSQPSSVQDHQNLQFMNIDILAYRHKWRRHTERMTDQNTKQDSGPQTGRSRRSDKATGWTSEGRFPAGARKGFFSLSPRPDRLWGLPNLLSIGYWGPFPRGLSGQGVKVTTRLHLVPRYLVKYMVRLHRMLLN